MKTLYLDIFSGISGDMFLGALIDLGVDFHQLEAELRKLGLSGYHLHISRQQKNKIAGTKFDVHLGSDHCHAPSHDHDLAHALDHRDEDAELDQEHDPDHEHEHEHVHEHGHEHGHHHEHGDLHQHEGELEHGHVPGLDQNQEHEHDQEEGHEHEHGHEHHHHDHGEARTFKEIKQLIAASPYSTWVKQRATSIFQRLAVAEGQIHGCPPDEVHFHEVGALDSIVDIVGACLALELLGKPRVRCAPVVDGSGWIDCAHGRFPIPAPATLAVLGARQIPVSQCNEPHELVTPTGAALLAEFAESVGPLEATVASQIGYGLGTRDFQSRPNVLRAILSEAAGAELDWEVDTIAVLETNLDDINSEILGYFSERAFQSGALDVFHTPIQMKKNRPGVLLTVLCAPEKADRLTELMLCETTAFGVRRSMVERRKLPRSFQEVQTPYGPVSVKVGKLNGRMVQVAPEFESCKQLAAQSGKALKVIYEAAVRAIQL